MSGRHCETALSGPADEGFSSGVRATLYASCCEQWAKVGVVLWAVSNGLHRVSMQCDERVDSHVDKTLTHSLLVSSKSGRIVLRRTAVNY